MSGGHCSRRRAVDGIIMRSAGLKQADVIK